MSQLTFARATRSRLACVLAFTAISLTLTGAAAQASPATGLAAPHPPAAVHVHDSTSEWVFTTDPASGISVKLPGQPTINTTAFTADGKSFPVRMYTRKLSKINGGIIFSVLDAPAGVTRPGPAELDTAMDGFVQGVTSKTGGKGEITSSRHFDLDGHPAADGRFAFTTDKGTADVGVIRLVCQDNHLVMIATLGAADKENTMTRIHQKVLGTLQLSGSPQ
jgi:hypothetical protein